MKKRDIISPVLKLLMMVLIVRIIFIINKRITVVESINLGYCEYSLGEIHKIEYTYSNKKKEVKFLMYNSPKDFKHIEEKEANKICNIK